MEDERLDHNEEVWQIFIEIFVLRFFSTKEDYRNKDL